MADEHCGGHRALRGTSSSSPTPALVVASSGVLLELATSALVARGRRAPRCVCCCISFRDRASSPLGPRTRGPLHRSSSATIVVYFDGPQWPLAAPWADLCPFSTPHHSFSPSLLCDTKAHLVPSLPRPSRPFLQVLLVLFSYALREALFCCPCVLLLSGPPGDRRVHE